MKTRKYYKKNKLINELKITLHGLKFLINYLLKIKKDREISFLEKSKYIFNKTAVIDIGANSGDWSMTLSDLVTNNGKVIAYEPHPYFYRATRKAIKYSLKKNIRLYKLAVGSIKNKSKLIINENNVDLKYRSRIDNSINKNKANDYVYIETVRLDEHNKDIDYKISIIKIDVEGYEYEVIKGSERIIKENSPIIIFEINEDKKGRENYENIQKILYKYDYKIYYVNERMNLKRFNNFKQIQLIGTNNLIAIVKKDFNLMEKSKK
tara:strand:- start:1836 stop:2630 length:795 start_codon:yes stop_codon:yes gene_type:complete